MSDRGLEPDALQEAARWLQYARDDADAAEVLLEAGGTPARIAAFHAQQAAEKAIKAVLVAEGQPFPFTHDLIRLIELVPDGWSVRNVGASWSALSDHAVDARYPDDLPDVSAAEASDAIDDARRVVEAVAADLGPLFVRSKRP